MSNQLTSPTIKSNTRSENLEVIYEDNHLIAVNKRPSDIVQGDKTGDIPLSERIKQYIKRKYDKPGEVFLGVVHRLDRPTSGVVLFARTSKSLTRLNKLFQDREVEKKYWAVVKACPEPPTGALVHHLRKNQKQNKSYVTEEGVKGSKRAELKYALIKSSTNYHLLEINPKTGRHHQIRAQLATIGCPIKGDIKYGFDRTNKDASIHLHARQLTLVHPVRKESITFMASPPQDSLWKALTESD